jgi:predicted GH43/DUF377 family glycosyl hydrolase
VKLTRYNRNPILAPDPGSLWESGSASNPAAWIEAGKVMLLYQAERDDANRSGCFGMAASDDGFRFRRSSGQPVFTPSLDGWDAGSVENPHVVKFGNVFFVTYAARLFSRGPLVPGGTPTDALLPVRLPSEAPHAARENAVRTGMAITEDFKTWKRLGPITQANARNGHAMILPEQIDGEFVMLHQPTSWIGPQYGCTSASIWISFSSDLLVWHEDHILAQPVADWEAYGIQASAPPLKTPAGWLLLYCGVDQDMVHRAGALLLDEKDPLRIIGRTPDPILEPEAVYERQGTSPYVVIPCSQVVIDDQLFVYYGGAARFCCLATAPLGQLLDHLLSHPWHG